MTSNGKDFSFLSFDTACQRLLAGNFHLSGWINLTTIIVQELQRAKCTTSSFCMPDDIKLSC